MSLKHVALGLTVLPFVAATSTVQADVLAAYTFDGANFVSGDTEPFSTATPMAVGAGLTSSIEADWRRSGSYLRTSADSTPGSEAIALAPGSTDYMSFSITPEAGYMLNLESVSFDGSTSWGGSTGAAWNIAIYSSVDGFTSGAGLAYYGELDGSSGNAWVNKTQMLAGSQYQGLTGTVDFRVYIWDGAGSASSYVHLDEVVVNGTTSLIPEPASMALVGLGGAMALIRRRHQK